MSVEKQEKNLKVYVPMPLCIINSQGKVVDANEHIGEVFIYDDIIDADIFTLTGFKTADLYAAADNETHPLLKRNEKIFRLVMYKGGEDCNLGIIFHDVTNLEELKDRYNNEKPCVAKIQVDNYDQLFESSGSAPNLSLSTEIDKTIRKWAVRINASVTRIKSSSYIVWFEQQYLDRLIANKFDLLDDVRQLESGADFPASLSMGIGVGGKTLTQTEEYADAALDLALGRGGDQAVVKRNIKIEYYGGKLQTVEKSNKGKSRIFGHALKQHIDQSKRIFIMGHRYADMDSFGGALGIMRLCALFEKEPYIVIDEISENMASIFRQAKESDEYKFVSSEKAVAMAQEEGDDLVIVVDTHRPSLVQCPELLNVCERIVVIDHHRRVEDFIENPVLAYMESYASSTSELVSEILQFTTSKKVLLKLEAEALLAGMTVDTNGFTVKTGVRTFDAAAWLRRQGADPTEVKRFFQEDFCNIKLKAAAMSAAQIFEGGIAITTCEQVRSDAQVLCAQVADQLLTIRGVKASFTVGRNMENKTVISARSLGEVNVQVIMEKFGGGGHLTTAAAQVETSIDETVCKIMEIMEVNKQ